MIEFTFKHPRAHAGYLGYIPQFLSPHDPRPAVEQIDSNYIGGWSDFEGFRMDERGNLHYPGDPPTLLVAEAKLRDEIIRVYEHAWVAVVQPDGSYRIARLD